MGNPLEDHEIPVLSTSSTIFHGSNFEECLFQARPTTQETEVGAFRSLPERPSVGAFGGRRRASFRPTDRSGGVRRRGRIKEVVSLQFQQLISVARESRAEGAVVVPSRLEGAAA